MKIEMKHVYKSIRHVTVLEDINMCLSSGNIYGLRGKNGSGKTMLMRLLCGLMFPSEGSILIDGKRLGKDLEFPESVGVLIETPSFLNNYTGLENLRLVASIQNKIGVSEIEDALLSVGLNPKDKRKYKKYSLGMKQRLGIACALMENPDLVLLDEPTNALDASGVALVRQQLEKMREQGKLILISSHDADELDALANEVIVMAEGKIVDIQTKE